MSDIHDDRHEIEAVLIRYAKSLDSKQYARLTEVFTPEATAHYVGMAECNGVESIISLVSGDLSSCYLQAIHAGLGDYSDRLLIIWGEYRDQFVRTPAGWRIGYRELTTLHAQGDIGLAPG